MQSRRSIRNKVYFFIDSGEDARESSAIGNSLIRKSMLLVISGMVAMLLLVVLWASITQPLFSRMKATSTASVDPARLAAHVRMLSETLAPRDAAHVENLDRVAVILRQPTKLVHAYLEAKRLLTAEPALLASHVALAVDDPSTTQFHLLKLPKSIFLRRGAEASVITSREALFNCVWYVLRASTLLLLSQTVQVVRFWSIVTSQHAARASRETLDHDC